MYTDTHCHLDMIDGHPSDELIDRALEAEVSTLLTVGVDLASSAESVQTASAHPAVWAVVGIHPHNAIEATEHVLQRLSGLAQHPRVVGIGETGLDYFRDHSPHDRQEQSFREHIRMAKEHDRALVIHCREAHEDTLRVLGDEQAPERTVFHCFSGDVWFAKICAREGWYASFSGTVTFKNAPELRAAAKVMPVELLLTETDSPYLSPHPHRGQMNEPARVPLIAAQLASIHGLEPEEMGWRTSANARAAFGLPDTSAS
ncbi:MAG: TatD family hydrolase [Egibacteraceae bacterium]